jgi:hypothetical protein
MTEFNSGLQDVGGIPWDQRDSIGMGAALWQTIKMVLLKPNEFFDRLVIGPSFSSPLLFYVIIAVPVSVIGITVENIFKAPADKAGLGAILSTCLVIPIAIFI